MAKTKISEYSATANSNTDIGGINVDEGCAPSGINDAIRTLMAQLKNFQTGTGGDSFNGPVGTTTAAAGAFTTLSASGVATFSAGSASAPALTTSGDTNTGVLFPAADTVGITTGGTERVRVDSSGNVGIGVSPSAWNSAIKAIEVAGGGQLVFDSAYGTFGTNAYLNSSVQYIYKTTAAAAQYSQANGQHQWYYAPSGTAGNAISFTQAMTLDASGNLGVGTTSPGKKLSVKGASYGQAEIVGSSGAELYFASAEGGSGAAYSYNVSSGYLATYVGGSERARIDSSGNLLVGTTTAIDNGSVFKNPEGKTALSAYRASTQASYGIFAAYSDIGGAQTIRAYFRSDGGLANYSANNANLSDENLKKDIVLAGNYLAKICAIPVKNFRYKDQSESEDVSLGVIAQDVLAVAPELVSQEGFGTSEANQQSYLSVYQTDLQYALMKCIQEQQAIIQTLTSRIEALEQA